MKRIAPGLQSTAEIRIIEIIACTESLKRRGGRIYSGCESDSLNPIISGVGDTDPVSSVRCSADAE